ncbi:MAG: Peroxisomal membrane protein PAS20 [Chaenotheca gracillima]|nr:MAG: Peroxisomal membrane protein PAS20 [Chaenotheca gracillima]
METSSSNPLLSSHKSTDGFQILLHPLVLLTISDYITRHTLRQQPGSVVGALLGQQNGREISLEHAFECILVPGENGEVLLDQTKFEERLQQYKDVHKVPALDFVGWFTVTLPSGPQLVHLPIHRQITQTYNESAILLAFHPSSVAGGVAAGGKLPLTIYESVFEGESADNATGQSMETDSTVGTQNLRFRELPYNIDTGEAEMIGVDFVARGGGNAALVNGSTESKAQSQSDGKQETGKGKKGKMVQENGLVEEENNKTVPLSPEDEELVASLTTRANAIKMLHSRIVLLKQYLSKLPPSYLTDPAASSTVSSEDQTELNFPLLRSIQALVGRLSLLIPADKAAFEREVLAEKNDVSLVTLMGSLTKSAKDISEAGRRFQVSQSMFSPKSWLNPSLKAMETQRHMSAPGSKRANQSALSQSQMSDQFAGELSPGGGSQRMWAT